MCLLSNAYNLTKMHSDNRAQQAIPKCPANRTAKGRIFAESVKSGTISFCIMPDHAFGLRP